MRLFYCPDTEIKNLCRFSANTTNWSVVIPTGLKLYDLCYASSYQIWASVIDFCLSYAQHGQFVPGAEFVRKMLCYRQIGTQSAKSAAMTACFRQTLMPRRESKSTTRQLSLVHENTTHRNHVIITTIYRRF